MTEVLGALLLLLLADTIARRDKTGGMAFATRGSPRSSGRPRS